MSIGDNIKARRLALGLSVDELAQKIGKNRATVYRYESKEIENLTIQTLEPLARALDTTPGELMGVPDSTLQDIRRTDKAAIIAKLLSNASEEQMDNIAQYIRFVLSDKQ